MDLLDPTTPTCNEELVEAFSFDYSVDEYARGRRAHHPVLRHLGSNSAWQMSVLPVLLLGLPVSVLASTIVLDADVTKAIAPILQVALLAGGLHLWRSPGRKASAFLTECGASCTMQFSTHGVTHVMGGSRIHYAWESVTAVRETPEFYLIHVDSNNVSPVPMTVADRSGASVRSPLVSVLILPKRAVHYRSILPLRELIRGELAGRAHLRRDNPWKA